MLKRKDFTTVRHLVNAGLPRFGGLNTRYKNTALIRIIRS